MFIYKGFTYCLLPSIPWHLFNATRSSDHRVAAPPLRAISHSRWHLDKAKPCPSAFTPGNPHCFRILRDGFSFCNISLLKGIASPLLGHYHQRWTLEGLPRFEGSNVRTMV